MTIIFSFSIICQCIAVIIHETKMLNTFPMQERSHLDTAITFMGAFFGMQNCSKAKKQEVQKSQIKAFFQVVACRAGRMAAERVSGAAVFVMMAESFVPRGVYLES